MELRFVKEDSVSQKEKVKAFWKFLDAQNNLQPYEGILFRLINLIKEQTWKYLMSRYRGTRIAAENRSVNLKYERNDEGKGHLAQRTEDLSTTRSGQDRSRS